MVSGTDLPLFKSDDKLNPENYTPICVTSCSCKLFCLLLNERLSLFLTKNKIISPCQIGFQNKSRTTDQIFCLKSLVNKFVHNTERGKIYACFVDFKRHMTQCGRKAYLPNSSALMSMVVCLDIIKDMYSKSSCAVKIGNKRTNFFRCKKGVHQGCPLSTSLFNIYINDIEKRFSEVNDNPITLDNGTNISCLLYADDIVIMSLSEEGLQKCLDELNKFCKEWKLTIKPGFH